MIARTIAIGRWAVEFIFCPDGYEPDEIVQRLYELGASVQDMREAERLMLEDGANTGFMFPNPVERLALVVIGPTTSGAEFQDTLVHELHHLAVAIARELGIDLRTETPAYIAGDSARELADVVCRLGCTSCH